MIDRIFTVAMALFLCFSVCAREGRRMSFDEAKMLLEKGEDTRAKIRGAKALGELGGRKSAIVLLDALDTRNESLRDAIAEALQKIPETIQVISERYEELRSKIDVAKTEDEKGEIGLQISGVLTKAAILKDNRLLQLVEKSLSANMPPVVRRSSIAILKHAKWDSEVEKLFIQAVSDPDWEVRWNAYDSMRYIARLQKQSRAPIHKILLKRRDLETEKSCIPVLNDGLANTAQ